MGFEVHATGLNWHEAFQSDVDPILDNHPNAIGQDFCREEKALVIIVEFVN